jgi:hypothetical protein
MARSYPAVRSGIAVLSARPAAREGPTCGRTSRPQRWGYPADALVETRFDEPIELPDGRKLLTLHDAATYATNLAKKEAASPEWQAAIEALILVAELAGPTMFARIGVMRALNAGKPDPAITPRRKSAKAYRIVK